MSHEWKPFQLLIVIGLIFFITLFSSVSPTKFYCGGFARPEDGFNIMKQKLLGLIAGISCFDANVTIMLPMLKTQSILVKYSRISPTSISFENLFDIDALRQVLSKPNLFSENSSRLPERVPIAPPLLQEPACCSKNMIGDFKCTKGLSTILTESIYQCNARTATMRDAHGIKALLDIVGLTRFSQIFSVGLKPAPPIQKIANGFFKRIGILPSTSCLCLHLRIEKDYLDYFRGTQRAVSLNEYVAKMRTHRNENPNLYQNLAYIYIAGDHGATIETRLAERFSLLFNISRIYGHSHLSVEPLYAHLANIQRSALDQAICEKCQMFVGNSGSGWSHMLVYTKGAARYLEAGRSNPFFDRNVLDFDVRGSSRSLVPFASETDFLFYN